MTKMNPENTPKRRGRPPGSSGPRLSPENATQPRSMRLNDARWAKLQRLGRDWLERAIDDAQEPTPDNPTKDSSC